MAYRVFWEVPQGILRLELAGVLSLEDFSQINQTVSEHLGVETSDRRLALLVDTSQLSGMPSSVAQLQVSQKYLLRQDLQFILITGSTKLVRLLLLLTFNLCRASLRFFDNTDQALVFAQRTLQSS